MTRIMYSGDHEKPPPVVMEAITDPAENARATAAMEKFQRNDTWLQEHWADVLPQARGKYVAVANQQAYIADTSAEAVEWCDRNHPGDVPVIRYVRATPGPRIYAAQR